MTLTITELKNIMDQRSKRYTDFVAKNCMSHELADDLWAHYLEAKREYERQTIRPRLKSIKEAQFTVA